MTNKPNVTEISAMAVQSAAIPYRYGDNGQVQILLVTSRKKGRWVLPKGHVRRGMVPHSSAAKEAFEEAGVIGRTDPAPIASYQRKLKESDGRDAVRVDVYAMAVMTEAPVWPEMHERKRQWATVPDALSIVADKGIRKALKVFEAIY
ncbi:MAG: NUDIX hydrolase [Sphingobium sp.]